MWIYLTDKDSSEGCSLNNGGCEQNCTDLEDGGHLCHCDPGYIVNQEDKTSCNGM